MIAQIKELSALFGPSGWEDRVRQYLLLAVKPYQTECFADKLGNLHVLKKGKTTPQTPVVLTAYMDEPGFMVKDITKEGMVRFGLMGGIDVRSILGKTVLLGEECHKGVVGRKPIHLTTPEERKTMPKADELYIDIGARDHVMGVIRVQKGDCGVFAGEIAPLGSHQLYGKALGRAVSCGVLLEVMRRELPVDTHFVFAVSKVAGNRGIYGAAERYRGSNSLHLDICPCEEGESLPRIGHGLVVPAMDRGTVMDDRLRRLLLEGQEASSRSWAELPIQTQGAAFRQRGSKAVALCCPAKYITAPCPAVDVADVERMPGVVMTFLEKMEDTKWN